MTITRSSKRSTSASLRSTLARVVLGAAALSSAACGLAVQQTALNDPPRPLEPKSPEQVEVYTSARPTRPYRDVLLLQMEEESVYASKSEAEILRRLRATAASRGCDGIIVLGQSGNVQSSIDGEHARTLRGLRATCVVYEAPPHVAAPSPPAPSAPPAADEREL